MRHGRRCSPLLDDIFVHLYLDHLISRPSANIGGRLRVTAVVNRPVVVNLIVFRLTSFGFFLVYPSYYFMIDKTKN